MLNIFLGLLAVLQLAGMAWAYRTCGGFKGVRPFEAFLAAILIVLWPVVLFIKFRGGNVQ